MVVRHFATDSWDFYWEDGTTQEGWGYHLEDTDSGRVDLCSVCFQKIKERSRFFQYVKFLNKNESQANICREYHPNCTPQSHLEKFRMLKTLYLLEQ